MTHYVATYVQRSVVGVVSFVLLFLPLLLSAQPNPVDPRDNEWKGLPEVGRMIGTITNPRFSRSGEEFGSQVSAVGRIGTNQYASWIIGRKRADTSITGDYPRELFLYSGQASGLPQTTDGQRIGPTLIGAESLFHASGDWNSDGYIDLFIDMSIYGDTSFGNSTSQFRLSQFVVFWGNERGEFGLDDTTRIPSPGDSWMGARDASSADFDGDGLTDLLLWEAVYWKEYQPHLYPTLSILKGTRGKRWGEPGVPIFSGWSMTNLPSVSRIEIVDQDADSVLDIAFHEDVSGSIAHVAVLYGRPGALPDTTEVEGLKLVLANGHYSLFSDVTGDGAPELLVNTGTPELIRIYAGRPGQRLLDQYGSGYDPPIEGKGWWRRPWAEIWLPNKLDNFFTPAGFGKLYDLGDANLDGINDIWAYSKPYLICYTGGRFLDSLVDAMVAVPGTEIRSTASVGVIDSSGVPVIAIGYDYLPHAARDPFPGGVLFLTPDRAIPSNGYPRRLPDLPRATDVREDDPRAGSNSSLSMMIAPNPARDRVMVRWHTSDPVIEVVLVSILGEELRRITIDSAHTHLPLDLSGLPAGMYFITVRSRSEIVTMPFATY